MSGNFINIGVQADVEAGLAKMNIVEPTPIQSRTIPEALAGRNIIGQSATGTGKTLAYLLPILQKINGENQNIQAVILAPTFELAMQIFHQIELLTANADKNICCVSLIGGANINRQMEKLKKKPQIIVGSAKRIIEIKQKGKLRLDHVNALVLDEADKLLDDQNIESVKQVQSMVTSKCQYFLFSATIAQRTVNRAAFVKDPFIVSLKEDLVMKPDIENVYFVAEFRDKIEMLRKLSVALNVKRGLVFVNRNDSLETALEKLRFHGMKIASLNSLGGKMERKKAIEDFVKGKVQLLLATDVAARGLDIAEIDYVFNLDLPEDEKVYLHRTGRTGRAGKSGCAVTLVDPKEVVKLESFSKKIKVQLLAKRLVNGAVADVLRGPRKPLRRDR